MFDRFRDILTRIKFTRGNTTEKNKTHDKEEANGKIYALWLLVLPLLCGLVIGRLASVGIGYAFEKFSGTGGITNSITSGQRGNVETNGVNRGLGDFAQANPFRISPQKPPVVEEAPKPVEEVKPKEPEPQLEDLVLRGTLPGVGAWIENKDGLKLLLIGKNVDRFRLASVNSYEAEFRRGKIRIKKYITYGPIVAKKVEEAPKPVPAPKKEAEQPKQTGNIVAAMPGEQEGEVPSEIVNQLVQNPFDELKRIRMRPNDKAGGLEVQWIQNDSILKRLGVQRGDVIKSVNGIPFTNMGDIANSINSLMNSERFDVEVTRGGNNTALRYVVR
ncbi:MAG: hypothetical protein IJU48_01360 [Synergistaceae bacterium]|nr:hypothetical protein [Synergistaceae bacterium]